MLIRIFQALRVLIYGQVLHSSDLTRSELYDIRQELEAEIEAKLRTAEKVRRREYLCMRHPREFNEAEKLIWLMAGASESLSRLVRDQLLRSGQIGPNKTVFLGIIGDPGFGPAHVWHQFQLKVYRENSFDYFELSPHQLVELLDGTISLTTLATKGKI